MAQGSIEERPDARATPLYYSQAVPREFRGMLVSFEALELHQAFPRVHLYNHPQSRQGREVLGITLFLQRFPGYKFTWFLEWDVRWVIAFLSKPGCKANKAKSHLDSFMALCSPYLISQSKSLWISIALTAIS